MIISGSFVTGSAITISRINSSSILAEALFTTVESCNIQQNGFVNALAQFTDCDADFWVELDGTRVGPVGSFSAPQSGWLQNIAISSVTTLLSSGGHTASLCGRKVEGDGIVYVNSAGLSVIPLETTSGEITRLNNVLVTGSLDISGSLIFTSVSGTQWQLFINSVDGSVTASAVV